MLNALTVDLEDWYQTLDFNFNMDEWPNFEERVERNVKRILELLEKYNIKATFFVLGCIAKKHPYLIRELVEKGHGIGSHGSYHKLVYKQTPEEFREDLVYSKEVLEDITGQPIKLYRASSWSISFSTLWALEILEEEGFTCDSSMQPFKTPLSGMSGAPKEPFHPVINGRRLGLVEFPPTVLSAGGLSFPFSGGLYLRTLPIEIVKYALNKINKVREGMIYTHPWEIDGDQPRLKVSSLIKYTHYYNLKNTENKLEELIKNFAFAPLGEVIKDEHFPAISLTGNVREKHLEKVYNS